MLMITKIIAPPNGNAALILLISVSARTTAVIGMQRITVITIPITPAANPMIKVSALNTREMSLYEAPIERRIPISFVRSSTEI